MNAPNTPKAPLTNQQKLVRTLVGIAILVAGYFGLGVGDLFDQPDMTQVYALQTQVAVLEADNADLAALSEQYSASYDACVDNLDEVSSHFDTCTANFDTLQGVNQDLAAEIKRLNALLVATPTPTPTPSGTPIPVCKYVTVVADKVVSHIYKEKNKAGYPIMLPDEKSSRIVWKNGEVICVLPTLVRADGGRHFYEVLDPGDVYVDESKVK